jgi:predicted enzyme involved in methoxymalonyl-ACP biosynthesis
MYETKTALYYRLAWTELLAMYRTVLQIDMVKLVVLDVDDTLWRGVGVERAASQHEPPENENPVIEGWPIGIAEALGHLRRRGVLLAIVSKTKKSY